MKWYHYALIVGIVVIGYRLLKRSSSSSSSPATSTDRADSPPLANAHGVDTQTAVDVVTSTAGEWGGSMNLMGKDVRPAYEGTGFNPYPGWYRTGDGGWYRPETGEFYSPGSSPPRVAEPHFQDIDLSLGGEGVVATDPYGVIY
jgi:hypothetical protein